LVTLTLSAPGSPPILRILFGFIYVFALSGYSLVVIFWPKKLPSFSQIFIASTIFSLLLLYPAGVLTTIIEGQSTQAIFQRHLPNSIFSLFTIHIFISLVALFRRSKIKSKFVFKAPPKPNLILILALVIFAFMSLTNLNRADVLQDEYDLAYQAYNLSDGVLAARKAYTLSFSGHPPLMLHIKHFSMQILNPNGLDNLKDWQFRVVESVLGALTIIYSYILTRKHLGSKAAALVALLLSVNNYLVFMGRFFERSIYLTPFSLASIYWVLEHLQNKKSIYLILAGISLGAALLVKVSGITVLASVLLLLLIFKKKYKTTLIILSITSAMYLPVIFYNLGAYLTVGRLDTNFSRIFNVDHPFATTLPENPLLTNPEIIMSLLIDQFSTPVFILFAISLFWVLHKKNKSSLEVAMLLWFGSTLIFFSLTVVRAYYMVFIAIPLTIFSALFFANLTSRFPKLSLTVVIIMIYSAYYSYNTNINPTYSVSTLHNDSGSSHMPPTPFDPTRHFSLSARAWTESRGWKILAPELSSTLKEGDCLSVDESLDNFGTRRYLWTNDKVKEYYLGTDYQRRFPDCAANSTENKTEYYLSHIQPTDGIPFQTIKDDFGNKPFYLYKPN